MKSKRVPLKKALHEAKTFAGGKSRSNVGGGPEHMQPIDEVVKAFDGHGYDRVEHIRGSTYRDSSTVIVIPTRGMIHHRVVQCWQGLISPPNQKKAVLFASGHEVGKAYDSMISMILAHPELSKWSFVLCLEDDNLVPADAHIRLLETIEEFKFDAVGAMYWTKGDVQMPMAYGDPEEYKRTGVLDFKPRDVRSALANGNIMEVNGVAQGCTLFRMDLFRQIPPPWFVTVADVFEDGAKMYTQDLAFCEKAKRTGKRFGVDMRVRVGHLDTVSGEVF